MLWAYFTGLLSLSVGMLVCSFFFFFKYNFVWDFSLDILLVLIFMQISLSSEPLQGGGWRKAFLLLFMLSSQNLGGLASGVPWSCFQPPEPLLSFVPVLQVLLRSPAPTAFPPQCGVGSQLGAPASHSLGVTAPAVTQAAAPGKREPSASSTQAECHQLQSLEHPRVLGGPAHLPAAPER